MLETLFVISIVFVIYSLVNIFTKYKSQVNALDCFIFSICCVFALTSWHSLEIKELKQRVIILESKQVK